MPCYSAEQHAMLLQQLNVKSHQKALWGISSKPFSSNSSYLKSSLEYICNSSVQVLVRSVENLICQCSILWCWRSNLEYLRWGLLWLG